MIKNVIIVLIAIIISFFFFDKTISLYAQHGKYLDIFELISMGGDALYPIVFSILGGLFYYFIKKDLVISKKILYFLSAILLSGILVNILKAIFGRARPWLLEQDIYGFFPFSMDSYYASFPSGHTTTAFAVATALFVLFPRYKLLWYTYGVTIAVARIGFFDHYLSDVLAGALLGTFSALFLAKRYKKFFFSE